MSDSTRPVQCEVHAQTPATFVCVHLSSGVGCGFHCSADDPADPWPDAWCDLCEAAFQREGEWNDASEPKVRLMCSCCYEDARARNRYVPAPLHPGQLSVDAGELAALAHQACRRCAARQEEVRRAWPTFASSQLWRYDPETETMRFLDDDATVELVADVTVTGSFSTSTQTWMWAWGNEAYPHHARAKVDRLRVFGEIRGIAKFQQAYWPAEEIDGWEVTQIAADLLGAPAIYRAPMDHLMVFMLLDRFREVP